MSPRAVGIALALALSACTGPNRSTSSGASAFSSGSSAGGGSPSSGGTATSTSGGTGTTTGAPDAGCPLGDPGGQPEGSLCLFPFDCACGLACGSDVSGVSGNLVCEAPCVSDADCPLAGEHCQLSFGFCQGGLSGSCAATSANLEFYSCVTNSDCPCPLECYGDPILGAVCERPCNRSTGCADAGEFCNVQVGSCQESCNPHGLAGEFQACVVPTDCLCPFSCFEDWRRGMVCERPCTQDGECAADETCELDAGSCQRTTDCFGGSGGLSDLSACLYAADCACPLRCVDDPLLRPPGSTEAYRFCELCDGGACESVGGVCQPPVDGGYQSSDVQPCRSNADCICPNQCLPSADAGNLRCEQACATGTDCSDPGQFCRNAECVENYCIGQLLCDRANGLEDPPKVGDGTCVRLPPYTDYLCRANGTSRAACNPEASQSDTAELCAGGLVCIPDFDGPGDACARACAVNTDCGRRGSCDTNLGLCQAIDDGGACPLGTMLDDAGSCIVPGCTSPDAGEFQRSDTASCSGAIGDCLCPNVCTANFTADAFLCEAECNVDTDCLDPGQWCRAGECVDNLCAANSGLLCDLGGGIEVDAGRGTCLGLVALGSNDINCTAPGTATSACNRPTERADAAERCGLGFGCAEVADGGLACLKACLTASDCASDSACIQTQSGFNICLPLNDAGTCAIGQSSPPAIGGCGMPGDDPCGCGYDCVSFVCAQRCQRDSDCLVAGDICVGTIAVSDCVPGGD